MKFSSKKQYYILGICILLLIIIEVSKRNILFADFYHNELYPNIVEGINKFSSLLPFSIYDIFIVLAICYLLWQIIRLFGKERLIVFFNILIFIILIFIVFEITWGINYFSSDFFQRNQIERTEPDSLNYDRFVEGYIFEMNSAYNELADGNGLTPQAVIDKYNLSKDSLYVLSLEGYKNLSHRYRIGALPYSARAKDIMFSRIYAGMGILGYYGPFFAESHLNAKLLPHQVPFTYMHEMAHLVGITSEAEANFYAYEILVKESAPELRFSAYQNLLPHVMSNARRMVSRERYTQMIQSISPNILDLITYTNDYWKGMYSPTIGNIQSYLYDYYLKGNNISSGLTNYSEVVQLLISTRN